MAKKSKKKTAKKNSTAKPRKKTKTIAIKPKSAPKSKKSTAKSKKSTAKTQKSTGPTSVDGVLKKFKKERVTLETQLTSVRKKIEDFNKKVASMQEQVTKLTEKELSTEESISQLDQNRDAEVSQLLSKLGVKFTASGSEMVPNSPFAVLLKDKDGESSNGDSNDDDDS